MGRPKQFDPDDAVAAAIGLFWRKGYRATTPAELVAALGIGKSSLYHVFESKHALFEQSLRRYGDVRVAGLKEALSGPEPVKTKLLAALERIARPENSQLLRRGCLAVNTATELGPEDEAATAIARSVFQRMEQVLKSTIEQGQESGELAGDRDAGDLASLFLIAIIGMSVSVRAEDDTERLRRASRTLISLL